MEHLYLVVWSTKKQNQFFPKLILLLIYPLSRPQNFTEDFGPVPLLILASTHLAAWHLVWLKIYPYKRGRPFRNK